MLVSFPGGCRATAPDTDPLPLVKAHSQHTIGVEFSSRLIKLGEKKIKLQVRLHALRLTANRVPDFTSYGIQLVRSDSGIFIHCRK